MSADAQDRTMVLTNGALDPTLDFPEPSAPSRAWTPDLAMRRDC